MNTLLVVCLAVAGGASADMFQNFFGRQQPQQQQIDYQRTQNNYPCDKYLCANFACADSPVDCPCDFPDSQQKCVMPDGKNYVCIAKTNKGELGDFGGEVRDCKWAVKAWKGEV